MIYRKSKHIVVKQWRYASYFVLYPPQYKTDSSQGEFTAKFHFNSML
jgi:hypothetical protein